MVGERHQQFHDHPRRMPLPVLTHFRSGVAVIEMDWPVVTPYTPGISPVDTCSLRDRADRSCVPSLHHLVGNHYLDELKHAVDNILVVEPLDRHMEVVGPKVLRDADILG